MYKRRVKSGGLGIVRSTTSTQQKSLSKSDNVLAVSIEKDALETSSNVVDKNAIDDPDQVLSDSEPSPKKSRRYVNGISFVAKDNNCSSSSPLRSLNCHTAVSGQTKNKSQKSHNKRSQQKDCPTISPQKKLILNKSLKPKSFLEDLFLQSGLLLSDGKSSNILSK